MSEVAATYTAHTPHGTEEREVFLPAQSDPGDETTGRQSVGVNRCWHCGQMYVADQDHHCRMRGIPSPGILPQYDDLAAAIHRRALVLRRGGIWRDEDFLEDRAVDRLTLELNDRIYPAGTERHGGLSGE